MYEMLQIFTLQIDDLLAGIDQCIDAHTNVLRRGNKVIYECQRMKRINI